MILAVIVISGLALGLERISKRGRHQHVISKELMRPRQSPASKNLTSRRHVPGSTIAVAITPVISNRPLRPRGARPIILISNRSRAGLHPSRRTLLAVSRARTAG